MFSIFVLPILFVSFLPLDIFWINNLLCLLFVFIAFTDFLDGYLARKYNQITLLGTILDPLSDKFLLYSSLVSLVYLKKVYFYAAIIFIGREFWIMGLREIALVRGFSLPVNKWGKIKTFLQFSYIALTLINLNCKLLENVFLISALAATLYSGYIYTFQFYKKMRMQNEV